MFTDSSHTCVVFTNTFVSNGSSINVYMTIILMVIFATINSFVDLKAILKFNIISALTNSPTTTTTVMCVCVWLHIKCDNKLFITYEIWVRYASFTLCTSRLIGMFIFQQNKNDQQQWWIRDIIYARNAIYVCACFMSRKKPRTYGIFSSNRIGLVIKLQVQELDSNY